MEIFTKTFLGGNPMGIIRDRFSHKDRSRWANNVTPDGKRGTNNVIPTGEPPVPPGRSGIVFKEDSAEEKDKQDLKEDMVNHPKHYKIEGISEEVIDICEAMIRDVTKETGNPVLASHIAVVIQYVMRAHKKNGKEDYKKAIWYLNRAISKME